MEKLLRSLLGAGFTLAATLSSPAEITLPTFFSDHMVIQADTPTRLWGWARSGESVEVTIDGKSVSTMAANGRWEVELPPVSAGGPYTLHLRGFNEVEIEDVLAGEVWLASGQSNMNMRLNRTARAEAEIAAADYPEIRFFIVNRAASEEPEADLEGSWYVCSPETAGDFSGVAYHFARTLHEELDRPVAVLQSSVGGTLVNNWTSEPVLRANAETQPYFERYGKMVVSYPEEMRAFRQGELEKEPKHPNDRMPSGYFNAMIAPLAGYTMQGAIWYQGETDSWRAAPYARMFPDMIHDWRTRWGQGDFPFLFVQLPGFDGKPGVNENYPVIREIQRRTLAVLPHLGMAVTIDLGEIDDIHPKNKKDVGARLGAVGLREVYGREVIAYGPRFQGVALAGAETRVYFDTTGELRTTDGESLRGFEVRDRSGTWHPVAAEFDDHAVALEVPAGVEPQAVRYAWAGFPDGNLTDESALPASPFGSDPRMVREVPVWEIPE
jgi:sialate O-acetylesterase